MKILAWPAYKLRARNPFQYNLYTAMQTIAPGTEIAEFGARTAASVWKFDVLHLHWPDVFVMRQSKLQTVLRIAVLIAYLAYCRIGGVKVVWTAHNYKRDSGPNAALIKALLWKRMFQLLSGVIFLTESSRRQVTADSPILARKPNIVIPHGDYRALPTADSTTADPVDLQYFGSINPYKNVPALLRAFAALPEAEGVTLRLSGDMSKAAPDPQFYAELENLPPSAAARCLYEAAFQGDDELIAKVRAATLIVLPYHKVMNSGSAVFALTFGTPILCARMPLFEELQKAVGADWVIMFDGELDADALLAALRKAKTLKETHSKPDMSAFDWDKIAETTLKFYDSLVAAR